MEKVLGIWIDHREAIVVSIDREGQSIQLIKSGVEPHPRHHGGSRSSSPYGAVDISSESRFDERHKHQLHEYYQKIIDMMNDVDSIFIFGPGEAKTELQKEMQKVSGLSSRISGVETTDKMTSKQVAAKVRNFYVQQSRKSSRYG